MSDSPNPISPQLRTVSRGLRGMSHGIDMENTTNVTYLEQNPVINEVLVKS